MVCGMCACVHVLRTTSSWVKKVLGTDMCLGSRQHGVESNGNKGADSIAYQDFVLAALVAVGDCAFFCNAFLFLLSPMRAIHLPSEASF